MSLNLIMNRTLNLSFQDEAELNKIRYVLENWESDYIQSMIDAAYQKAMRYTTKNFMHYYSKINFSDPIRYALFFKSDIWENLS